MYPLEFDLGWRQQERIIACCAPGFTLHVPVVRVNDVCPPLGGHCVPWQWRVNYFLDLAKCENDFGMTLAL